jgi:hypothetical protein
LERDQVRPADATNSGISTAINDTVSERIVKPDLPCAFESRRRAFRALQELVVEGAERQRVADCGVGRAGSPSRPVAGWQPGFSTGGSQIRLYHVPAESSAPSLRPAMTTFAPSFCRPFAVARPMPLFPPVTIATFPSTRFMSVSLMCEGGSKFLCKIRQLYFSHQRRSIAVIILF